MPSKWKPRRKFQNYPTNLPVNSQQQIQELQLNQEKISKANQMRYASLYRYVEQLEREIDVNTTEIDILKKERIEIDILKKEFSTKLSDIRILLRSNTYS